MAQKINEHGDENLVIRLPIDMMARLKKALPYGSRAEILRNIIGEMLSLVESENRELFLGAFLSGRITFSVKRKETDSGNN